MKRSNVARQRRLGGLLLGGMGLALTLGACIIEERKYSRQLDNCYEYCDRIESTCTNNNRVYDSVEACLATCQLMESGIDEGDVTNNTLSCRLSKLRAGQIEGQQCAQVGPGSNGQCGSSCRALCELRRQVCSGVTSTTTQSDVNDIDLCEAQCQALSDINSPGVDLSGDTVHCRLAYVAKAAVSAEEAAINCSHSQIRPFPGEDPATAACSDVGPVPLEKSVECQKYCDLVTAACTDSFAVYTSAAQCLDTCMLTMEPGEPGDQTLDTIRCRRYHAYFALIEPAEHCLHASPTGDGHCGTENCTGHCRILQRACPGEFAAKYPVATACDAECAGLSGARRDQFALPPVGSVRYTVEPAPTGNTLMCRAFHAVEALTAPAEESRVMHCTAALGGGACGG